MEKKVKDKKSEKIESTESEEVPNEKVKRRENSQVGWAIFLMIAVIVIIILVPIAKYYYTYYTTNFEFSKLDFQIIQEGDLTFYEAPVPVIDNYGNITHYYTVSFRNDPRELDKIATEEEIEREGVLFLEDRVVYVTLNPNMSVCEFNSAALGTLGGFLGDSGLTVKAAYYDEDYSNETGVPYRDCMDSTGNTVIKLVEGDKMGLERTFGNCYVLEYTDCRIMEAVDKFNLEVLKTYMKDFEKV